VPEVLFARGHVLKRAGDLEGAARALEQARLLDKSDRFLNGKAGKYWLRAGQIEKARQVFGLFTKVSFELLEVSWLPADKRMWVFTERRTDTWSRSQRHAM
jgi:peptide alpha-N-acetyltransferase